MPENLSISSNKILPADVNNDTLNSVESQITEDICKEKHSKGNNNMEVSCKPQTTHQECKHSTKLIIIRRK